MGTIESWKQKVRRLKTETCAPYSTVWPEDNDAG